MMLLRHGEPEAAARGRCYGELDVALSPEGRAQAERRKLPPLEAVYSSPRRRAVETAELAAPGQRIAIEPALREIDFGRFEGLTYDQVAEKFPALYRQWMERPTEVTFPDGESWAGVRSRVRQFAARVREQHSGTILVVAHGGPLRALLAEALGLPDAHIFRLDQSYAGLSIIDWIEGVPLVRQVNG